jgi:hypothetical protein
MTLCKILRLLAAVAALGAAWLWYHASNIPIPTDALRTVDITADGSGRLAGVEKMSAALKNQGWWNSWAAAMTALAVILNPIANFVAWAFPHD